MHTFCCIILHEPVTPVPNDSADASMPYSKAGKTNLMVCMCPSPTYAVTHPDLPKGKYTRDLANPSSHWPALRIRGENSEFQWLSGFPKLLFPSRGELSPDPRFG